MANGDSSNPLQQYGYDSATGQQLAQSLGMTTQQLAAAFATTPMTGGGTTQGNFMGGSSMGTNYQPPSRDLNSTIQQLQLMKASGMGQNQGNQDAQNAAATASLNSGGTPLDLANRLGAAALNMPMIRNPVPGQGDLTKGGINTVGQPQYGSSVPTVPQGPWSNVAGVFGQPSPQSQGLSYWMSQTPGATAADAANIEKAQGMTPGTIGNQFYTAGVQSGAITPASNMAPTAGGHPTPVTPANAAGTTAATPWATAPPAPGADTSALHQTALENAGKAMFAHYGGDPSTATHADIQDFHNQLQSHIGSIAGGQPASALPQGWTAGPGGGLVGALPTAPSSGPTPNPGGPGLDWNTGLLAGVAAPAGMKGLGPPPAPGSAPVKMAQGGYVPGNPNDNTDSVPAYLSPGEYVVSKKRLSEAQHQALTTDQSAPPPAQTQPTQSQTPSTSAPSAPGLGGYTGPTAAQIMAQNQAANAAIGSGGKGSLDNLGTLGDEGMIGSMGIGVGSGPGSGMPTKQAAGVASGLASGLATAAKAYADSFKDWQVQQDATEKFRGNVIPARPAAVFQQQTIV